MSRHKDNLAPIDAMQCHQCHRFTSTARGVCFCNSDCAHEWSALRLHAETPAQIWEIVELVKSLLAAEEGHRAVTYGKLLQAARRVWGTARKPPPATTTAPHHNKQ